MIAMSSWCGVESDSTCPGYRIQSLRMRRPRNRRLRHNERQLPLPVVPLPAGSRDHRVQGAVEFGGDPDPGCVLNWSALVHALLHCPDLGVEALSRQSGLDADLLKEFEDTGLRPTRDDRCTLVRIAVIYLKDEQLSELQLKYNNRGLVRYRA